ncbi:hypothetical protein [Beijerinckia sp. L45]|uniref:hypothetical protein n=1 Tax=Beijerinckia sp. L45 TaxID=1641855 RepID=UPI00131B7229|nr:hypothetical protein [Beijerinckia sp. L45]
MTVSPKVSMAINAGFVLLGAIGGGALAIPDFIPAGAAHQVVSTASFVFGCYGIVNAYLHGVSAPQAGPLVAKPVEPQS